MGLFNSKAPSRGGGYKKTESVVILMDKISVPQGAKSSNWETDHLVGRLFYSALGVEAQYSPTGEPVTAVKVFQDKPKEVKPGQRPRPSVFGKQYKDGMSEKLVPGALVLMENATFDAARGGFVGGYMKVLSPKPYDPDVQFAARGWILVRPERTNDTTGKGRQYSTMVDGSRSMTFEGVDSFRQTAIDMIQAEMDNPSMPGAPGVVLRAIDGEAKQAMTQEIFAFYDGDLGRVPTAEEAVDRFIKGEEAKAQSTDQDEADNSWTVAIRDQPEIVFELSPAAMVGTGSQSLPSARCADKGKGVPADYCDSAGHCTYGHKANDRDGNEKTYDRHGFVKADVLAVRKLGTDIPGWEGAETHTQWSRTYTRPTGEARELRARTEFPSATLPADVEEAFSKRGVENSQAATKWRNDRKEKGPEGATADAAQDMAPAGP